MQHVGEDVDLCLDASLVRALRKHDAVVKQSLVASHLQVDRRETGQFGRDRASVGIGEIGILSEQHAHEAADHLAAKHRILGAVGVVRRAAQRHVGPR